MMFLVGGYWCDRVEISFDLAIGIFWSCLDQNIVTLFRYSCGVQCPYSDWIY